MRKKLLFALGFFFLLSIILLLTRNSRPSLFFQGISQLLYTSPKSKLYSLSVSTDSGDEISKLREQNAKLREELVELEHLRKDNIALKSQFEEETLEPSQLLPANIIGFQGGITRPDVIILDKGKRDNVVAGQAVIVGKNLIGVIQSVSDQYSSVLLITNSSFSTVAKVSGGSALGVVNGAGEFLLFNQIAITDQINDGATVITRGEADVNGRKIPADLVIGVVESVRKVESEPFQSARIKSLVQIGYITRVFIWQ